MSCLFTVRPNAAICNAAGFTERQAEEGMGTWEEQAPLLMHVDNDYYYDINMNNSYYLSLIVVTNDGRVAGLQRVQTHSTQKKT